MASPDLRCGAARRRGSSPSSLWVRGPTGTGPPSDPTPCPVLTPAMASIVPGFCYAVSVLTSAVAPSILGGYHTFTAITPIVIRAGYEMSGTEIGGEQVPQELLPLRLVLPHPIVLTTFDYPPAGTTAVCRGMRLLRDVRYRHGVCFAALRVGCRTPYRLARRCLVLTYRLYAATSDENPKFDLYAELVRFFDFHLKGATVQSPSTLGRRYRTRLKHPRTVGYRCNTEDRGAIGHRCSTKHCRMIGLGPWATASVRRA
eukprot:2194851-Rhodomonas_salina.5